MATKTVKPAEFAASEDSKNRSQLDTYDVSVGAISKSTGNEPTETTGIKIRGTGAATKGLYARGPMA